MGKGLRPLTEKLMIGGRFCRTAMALITRSDIRSRRTEELLMLTVVSTEGILQGGKSTEESAVVPSP